MPKPEMSKPEMSKPAGHRSPLLHIFAFTSLAAAQPLLDIIARNPELLVARQAELADLLLLLGVICILLPLICYTPLLIMRYLAPALEDATATLVLSLLLMVLVLLVLKNTVTSSDTMFFLIALGVAGLFALLYSRHSLVRMYCSYLSPVIALVPAIFLLNNNVSSIVFGNTQTIVSDGVADSTPVVMLVLDELPLISLLNEELEIDRERFPNFAALATDSHWFRNARTVSAVTTHATPALLSGVYRPNALPILNDYPQNLFSLLRDSHELHVSETVTNLCPPRLCGQRSVTSGGPVFSDFPRDLAVVYLHLLTPPELSKRLPVVSQGWSNFAGPALAGGNNESVVELDWSEYAEFRTESYQAFLASITNTDTAALHFHHALFPHMPWEYLPSGKLYALGVNSVPGLNPVTDLWGDDSYLVNQGYQRHLLQLAYVDSLLGELLNTMKRKALYDEALLVVVSDHGANFRPGFERRDRQDELVQLDVEAIPLFIKLPGQQRGEVQTTPATTLDVLPTVAAALNRSLVMEAEGRDLFNTSSTIGEVKALSRSNSTLQQKLALFGSGDIDAIYRFGPLPGFLGVPINSLDTIVDSDLRFAVDQQSLLAAVNPAAPFLPARLSGRIFGAPPAGDAMDLLLALNGTVVASFTSYPVATEQAFSVLLPETAFVAGNNEVAIYRVTDRDDGNIAVEQLRNDATSSFSYTVPGNSDTIVDQLGKRIRIDQASMDGVLDRIRLDNGYLQLRGWAIDTLQNARIDYLLLDIDGELGYAGRPFIAREDIVTIRDNPALLYSGFELNIPVETFYDALSTGIRLIAVRGERASSISAFHYTGGINAQYRLESDSIIGPNGTGIEIIPQGNGHIDEAVEDSGLIRIRGWAGNASGDGMADFFLLRAGDNLIHLRSMGLARPDVVTALQQPALSHSGFSLVFPTALIDTVAADTISLYAVSGDQASAVGTASPLGSLLNL